MGKRVLKIVLPLGVLAGFIFLMWFASHSLNWQVIDTKGTIGNQQRDLLFLTSGLMLLIIIPIFILLFIFAYKYRDGRPNQAKNYTPKWADNYKLELIWWGIPIVLIGILMVVAWKTSHSLDPYRPLESSAKPLEVQVIGLQWRWLFVYPEHNVASLNELHIPAHRPIAFSITSDAPMNSFWIPQLGGQVYAMSGMTTKLHLIADEPGTYKGVAANITGKGHASMTFNAHTTSQKDFDTWLKNASSSPLLSGEVYEQLREPSTDMQVKYYSVNSDLFQASLDRYNRTSHENNQMEEN